MTRRFRALRSNVALALLSVVFALGLAEGALHLLGLPEEHRPHGRDPQFVPVAGSGYLYTNVPSARIRFHYDSNPRGYFGPGGELVHRTNSRGFRGGEFSIEKPGGTVRFLFLGDSFTFGEGVKDGDTYPEQFRRLVVSNDVFPGRNVEVINLGVGGYNTSQEAALLRELGMALSPDFIVVGYSLNDAEPDLYYLVPGQGWGRRPRGRIAHENVGTPEVPSPLGHLRLTRLVYFAYRRPQMNRETIAYYQSLYADKSPSWTKTKEALGEIARLGRERGIPVTVLVFPVFFRLGEDYPFRDLHEEVKRFLETQGVDLLDLYPVFEGLPASELWVHPADQHPNEKGHALVASKLFEHLGASRGWGSP